MWRFPNRTEAGRELASMLHGFKNRNDAVVLALPRGGAPVAFEVARALKAPLDVFTVRKIGAPQNEEYALGAIATGGVTAIDWSLAERLDVSDAVLGALMARARDELERREQLYRGDRGPLELAGKTVILVDDGLATGATMRAAISALRTLKPARIAVAVPVASREAAVAMHHEADAFFCAFLPSELYCVGQWYRDFSQTTDAEVLELLRRAEEWTLVRRAAEATTGAWYA
jgi:putative phosphoribosyl transferase